MNGRHLTDAQISQALRAHLPRRAQAGLRERILEAAETTAQQRALPSFLGAFRDADPDSRRRSLLIAATLLVALAVASAAVVGALRLLDRDPIHDLSLAAPADVEEYVSFSYDRIPELSPVAITTLDSDGRKGRIHIDRSGSVRIERYASADATEPLTSMILSGGRFGRTVTVGPDTVWVEQDGAFGEDPRVYLLTLSGLASGGECESTEDLDDVGNGASTTGWRYVGVEDVAGRPAHHVACDGDLWFDIETGLTMRSRSPLFDDAEQPIPGAYWSIEVTEIEFAEQPAALFAFVPPDGVAAMSIDEYLDLCGPGQVAFLEGPPCSGTARPPEDTPRPEPSPTPDVPRIPSDCTVQLPSEPTGPLTWTQASLTEDWPAPVRPEPAGGAIVQVIPATIDVSGVPRDQYVDPSGDTGSDCHPWVDIQELGGPEGFGLASNQPPVVDPTEQWVAYGVVFDEDRDGVPDWRYGIDNMPFDATGGRPHRAWRTELHTGRTESAPGPPYYRVGETYFDSYYPPGYRSDAHWSFGADTPNGRISSRPSGNYYLWASVIEDGRVVATDYAPDLGWLDPSLLGRGRNSASPFREEKKKENGACVYPPQRGCRETDRDEATTIYFTVPDGWASNDSESALTKPDTGTVAPSGMSLHFRRGGWLYSQPCRNADGPPDIRVGPTASDFADALATHPLLDVTTPVRVTLGGHSGRYVELRVPSSISDCTAGYHPWGPGFATAGPDKRWHIWSLNVDDVRVVIVSEDFPGTSAQDRAEMRAIIESIQFNP